MKLLSSSESTVTTKTFEIDYDGQKIIYIEYLNEKGKVVDCSLRDEDGNEIAEDQGPDNNAAETLEKIQDFIDKIEGN